jgi:hypothetical protein
VPSKSTERNHGTARACEEEEEEEEEDEGEEFPGAAAVSRPRKVMLVEYVPPALLLVPEKKTTLPALGNVGKGEGAGEGGHVGFAVGSSEGEGVGGISVGCSVGTCCTHAWACRLDAHEEVSSAVDTGLGASIEQEKSANDVVKRRVSSQVSW